jgi:hypothetical protein
MALGNTAIPLLAWRGYAPHGGTGKTKTTMGNLTTYKDTRGEESRPDDGGGKA